jgi:FAD/FMN-containing dehydrogenase
MIHATEAFLEELRRIAGPENVVGGGSALEALSRDFYWYSPVLRRLLDGKLADAVVRPGALDELREAVAACARAGAPVVARGAGTGNYGQCVPLHGGIVVDLSRLDRIHSVEGGVARVEPGARMGAIESAARESGWELRCMPSTWVKATLGGFLCGGSGGIGSITWGGINAPGNVKSLTILTCEESPRLVRLEEEETLKALHTYGTTGILSEIEMRLAPKVDYDQLIFSTPDWDRLLGWTDAAARRVGWRKRLVTQFEWPVPSFFKPLQRHLRAGDHATFLLLDRAQAGEAVRDAEAAGIACAYHRPLLDPPRPPFITDFTWNHTTLWAIQSDPAFTYLQAGFGPDFRGQFAELARRFPGEILLHLEWTVGNAKMLRANAAAINAESVVVGGIPLVRFRSEERLAEILDCCREIGVFIANPHTFYLEEGGRHTNISDKRALKAEVDPRGLLNPGKMRTYPYNPFETPGAPA